MICIVFFSGYLLMALEILAFRVIQLSFGNSIYSTGAVLGVILSAMTLGYWLGGNLSVRIAPMKIQGIALISSGLWIILLGGLPGSMSALLDKSQISGESSQYFLDAVWKTIPEWVIDLPLGESIETRMKVEPLIGSCLLFFIPSFFLAMVGPCAVRGLVRDHGEAGKVSGWVYAVGSLGSIAGVLVTSFWLVAALGIGANFRLTGFMSFILGLVSEGLRLWLKNTEKTRK
jgi:hypothetical protein